MNVCWINNKFCGAFFCVSISFSDLGALPFNFFSDNFVFKNQASESEFTDQKHHLVFYKIEGVKPPAKVKNIFVFLQ